MLKNNFNLTEIGKTIGKHRTTISKEILNHRFEKESIQYGTTFANCTNINICQFAGCKSCKKSCKNFIEKKCQILDKTPYVCNGCKKNLIVNSQNFIIVQKMLMLNIKLLELNLELESEFHKKKFTKLIMLLPHLLGIKIKVLIMYLLIIQIYYTFLNLHFIHM